MFLFYIFRARYEGGDLPTFACAEISEFEKIRNKKVVYLD